MHSLLNNYQQYTSTNLFHNNNYTFTAKYAGSYTLECWGATGGGASDSSGNGALGGYAYGNASISAGSTLYVCVGGSGTYAGDNRSNYNKSGGYNGGGKAGIKTDKM